MEVRRQCQVSLHVCLNSLVADRAFEKTLGSVFRVTLLASFEACFLTLDTDQVLSGLWN